MCAVSTGDISADPTTHLLGAPSPFSNLKYVTDDFHQGSDLENFGISQSRPL